jgi:hypothetical protein
LSVRDWRTKADLPFAIAARFFPDLIHNKSFRWIVDTGATVTRHAQRLNKLSLDACKHFGIPSNVHSRTKTREARAKLRGPKAYRTGRKSKQPTPSLKPAAAEPLNDGYSLVTNE